MTPDRDDESGQYSEEFGRELFLAAVENVENATTSKVAEQVGCSYDLAYRRLKELDEAGKVESRKVGNSYLWSLS